MNSDTQQQYILECIDVASAYSGGFEVLSGVTFHIGAGERVGIVGPNGAGKTTLLRSMVGVQAFTGIIRVDGIVVNKHSLREIRMRLGLVFQNPDDQLFSSTVQDDVSFGPLAMGLPADEAEVRTVEALRSVGMDSVAERNPLQLSFGERRLAAIAGVLAMRPRILAMDEPSSNLDPKRRRRLIDWLNAHDGYTLLLVSHDLDMVAQCCDRVLLLNRNIVADGPAHTILCDADLLEKHSLELPFGLQTLRFRSENRS